MQHRRSVKLFIMATMNLVSRSDLFKLGDNLSREWQMVAKNVGIPIGDIHPSTIGNTFDEAMSHSLMKQLHQRCVEIDVVEKAVSDYARGILQCCVLSAQGHYYMETYPVNSAVHSNKLALKQYWDDQVSKGLVKDIDTSPYLPERIPQHQVLGEDQTEKSLQSFGALSVEMRRAIAKKLYSSFRMLAVYSEVSNEIIAQLLRSNENKHDQNYALLDHLINEKKFTIGQTIDMFKLIDRHDISELIETNM